MPVDLAILTAIVSPVIRTLVKKLVDSALKEVKNINEVESNLKELASKASNAQRKLDLLGIEDLADSSFKLWLKELNELCYIVDDIIDDITLEIMRVECQHRSAAMESKVVEFDSCIFWKNRSYHSADNGQSEDIQGNKVRNIILASMTKWNLPHKIKNLQGRIEIINTQVEDMIRLAAPSRGQTPRGGSQSGLCCQIHHLPEGRISEKQNIIEKLLDMSDGGICIVGMAGLGKTVLARSIQNDSLIRRQCNVINWAYARENKWESVRDIVIEQIACQNDSASQQSSSSKGCRSLLLLDDLRNVGHRGWQNLRATLVALVGHEPTLLIITSRDPEVSEITETVLHSLPTLSVKDCEEIINNRMPSDLSVSRRQWINAKVNSIAQKCGGLPLAADAVSLFIRSQCKNKKRFISAVSDLEKKEIWTQNVFLRDVLPDLGFDETSLPRNLNKFLAYFALFPPEYNFSKHKLLQLWTAEGYTDTAPRSTTSPSIDHFDSLVSRSLLQLPKCSPEGRVKSSSYQMHNFVHRFAETCACDTHFRLNEGTASSITDNIQNSSSPSYNIHHISSCCRIVQKKTLQAIENRFVRMRTFLVFGKYVTAIQHDPSSLFSKLIYLRVLSLSGSDIKELPQTISSLKHLRYLDLSHTVIERLPIGVCKLLGLQVLKLNSCLRLVYLPEKFGDLFNLTYLDLDNSKLCSTPANIGKLTNLQTLIPAFIVERDRGHTISELKNMNSLQGSIKITKLENVINKVAAKEAMLHQKPDVRKLKLEWTKNSRQDSATVKDILTELKPGKYLTKLQVLSYNGSTFPTWVNTLQDLTSLYLYDCPSCTEFPQLGMLPLLKSLKIEKMCKMETIKRSLSKNTEDIDYPALQSLEICNMKELRRWEMLLEKDMPYLHRLHVRGCPKLTFLPMISRLNT